ncbi:hypothetical protein HHK36_012934 [Tetracentron sinense]|uniref:Uncharacterized protein n=1 Tax=Tetracentron sinense TaxID=13715 RepID=A0A835DG11_TETSI|nr:hypothetical protein HHK36_012934 [Tetracentron sinense]
MGRQGTKCNRFAGLSLCTDEQIYHPTSRVFRSFAVFDCSNRVKRVCIGANRTEATPRHKGAALTNFLGAEESFWCKASY